MKPVTGSKTQPQKEVASHDNRVPDSLFEGEILIDIAELNAEKKRICISPRVTLASIRTTRNSPTSSALPSHQQFSRGKIMPAAPKKQVKKREAMASQMRQKPSTPDARRRLKFE
jgi:hypothetical protein